MVQIDAKKTVHVEAKTFKLYVKVCDRCGGELVDQDGQTIHDAEGDGYVPDFFPGEHYGDYLILDIDIDTGQITNWLPPSGDQIQEWIGDEDTD